MKLREVQLGGDDCSISVILDAVREACGFQLEQEDTGRGGKRKRKDTSLAKDEKYGWIPQKVSFISTHFPLFLCGASLSREFYSL